MLIQQSHIHTSKYQNAMQEMQRAGLAPRDADPFVQRMMRRLGVPHRPAYYREFWRTSLVNGALFALIALPIIAFIYNREGLFSITTIVVTGLLSGALFGIGTALIVRRKAIEFKLSHWDAL